jgi:hypothetical protein
VCSLLLAVKIARARSGVLKDRGPTVRPACLHVVEVVPGMQPDRPLEGSRPQSCTECPPAWSDDADRSCSSRGAPRSAVLTALLSSQPSTESAVTSRTYASKSDRTGSRKEVIQPHLPVRLPCYDFVPIAGPTFDGSLPDGLGHRLRVLPTFMT